MDRLLGRDAELRSLRAGLDRLDARTSHVVAVIGEPGIGKSRLIGEAVADASARNCLVCSGRAAEFERDRPFGIFLDALDPYLGSLDSRRMRGLDAEQRAQLANVFPSLKQHAPADEQPPHERFASYRAVGALLSLLARDRPVVIALDDLHWADQASIELVGYLLRRPPSAAVLLLLAARVAQVPPRLERELAAAQDRDRCGVLSLSPLSRDQLEPLLAGLADAGSKDAVYAEAGGNPFYIQQLVRASKRTGPVPGDSSAVPDVPGAVRDALLSELDGVSSGVREVLDAAAVAGDPFVCDLVAEIGGIDHRDALNAIDQAISAGLVRATDVPGHFAFRHPIVRRAIYELTPAAWRVGAHGRAASALNARGSSLPARAHHVEWSATPGDGAAVELLSRAGREASSLAPASAARWFAAALRLLPDSEDPGARTGLLVSLATALAAAGRVDESSERLAQVLAALPPEQTVMRARVLTAMVVMDRTLGRTGQARTRLIGALEQLPESRTAEAAAVTIELAADRYFDGDWAGMGAPARRAHELAAASADVSLRAAAAAVAALAEINSGSERIAGERGLEASALLDELTDHELAMHLGAAHWAGWCAHHLERYGEVVRIYDRALAVARRRGQSHLLVPTLLGLTISYVWLGQLEQAQAQAEVAVETAHLVGAESMLALTYSLRAWVAVRGGGLHDALELAEAPVGRVPADGSALHGPLAHAWVGEAKVESGAPGSGRDELVETGGGEQLVRIEPCQRSYYFAVLTDAELALGDADAAARWAASASASAERYTLAGPRMWALRSAASVALARGDPDRAVALAGQASSAGAGTHPLERERCELVRGRALAAGGKRSEAVGCLEAARLAFAGFGAVRLAELCARELRALGERVPRSGRRGRAAEGIGSLSGRELEVAGLVCDRLTNREIAGRLVISEKTVERHMSHIFEKLGVGSRVAVARALERAQDGDGRAH